MLNHDLDIILRGKFEELGQSDESVVALVEDGDGPPAVAEDQRLVSPGQAPGVGAEVEGVVRPLVQDVPAGLDVRDLEVVTDGLDVVRGPPGLRPDDGGDTEAQQVANSLGRQEGIRGRNLLEVRRQPGVVEDSVVVDLVHGVPEGGLLTHVPPVLGPV